MRKNQLIKLLQEIKGNPEIHIWNGIVGDVVNILPKIKEVSLVKSSYETHLLRCFREEQRYTPDFTPSDSWNKSTKKDYLKYIKYDVNNYVQQKDIDLGYVKEKVVFVLEPEIKGGVSYARDSIISY